MNSDWRAPKWPMIFVWITLLSSISMTAFGQEKELRVTFISNEGFHLESNGKAVLIDALYKKSHPDFTFPSDDQLHAMIEGEPPFARVDFYLQSHVHYTHFYPATVGNFLNRHPETNMIALPQVVDSLVKLSSHYEGVKRQLMLFDWEKKRMNFDHNDVHIEAFKIKHDGQQQWGWVQNLGHVIDIGGFRVLHMGDLLIDEQVLNTMNLKHREIDLVILPYWVVLRSGAEKIKDLINAKKYIVSHYPIARGDQFISSVRAGMPEAIILNDPMQQLVLPAKE
ncbi:hypothetical protein BFP97_00055 [Roseivirga sp. 4D4]|uniref:MBL fold metallo-hydrolase n=1 Tax=Roseivirga sp. 4D4 TaxID=1889784 RepID=UPI00085321A2|nr:MBL fold metallo-hydrolase [Roseivirga sp. 4D4]OEK00008.1 hypothetical protein BFP97_00055 [Roseivirga sp. 4D4]